MGQIAELPYRGPGQATLALPEAVAVVHPVGKEQAAPASGQRQAEQ